jgi:Ca2+-binding RTX toxin-like protein
LILFGNTPLVIKLTDAFSALCRRSDVILITCTLFIQVLNMSEATNPNPVGNGGGTGGGLDILGTPNVDRLSGNALGNRIKALASDDMAMGGGGNDVMELGSGNDTGSGGDGNDVILGEDGNDKIMGELGDDVLRGGQGNDDMQGGDGNDRLLGEKGDDRLIGGQGNDFMKGGSGNDRLEGGDGDDVMRGKAGRDVLTGGNGNDTLIGSGDADQLTGNQGADTFIVNMLGRADRITDFVSGQDRIQIANANSAIVDGKLSFEVLENTQSLGASSASIVYIPSTGKLYYNPTSKAGDEKVFGQLKPGSVIDSSDIELF